MQMNKKVKNFLLTNKLIRRFRSKLRHKIMPIVLKVILTIFLLFVAIFIAVKIFKPNYIKKTSNQISFYFFHYFNLDNQGFGKVNINGNVRTTNDEINEIVQQVRAAILIEKDGNYQPLIQKLIVELKKKLPWLNQIVITRNMPDILNISVTEFEPFAVWQDDGRQYITDKDGNLVPISDLEEFNNLIILSGGGANHHARSLFNIVTTDSNLSSNIYSATWVGGRRWDIRLNNGLLIKLPEANISEAWQSLGRIYNFPGATVGLRTIDLRVKSKVYLDYDDSSIKKLKTI
jgi:cell division septal protein FtsQ